LATLIGERCAWGDVECAVSVSRDAAFSAVALRFRRATEWLEEIRPFVDALAAAGDTAGISQALDNLDRLYAAIEEMNDPTAAVEANSRTPGSAPAPQLSATGQTTTYAAWRAGAGPDWEPVSDDGALRRGSAGHYRDNGDGTIADMNTGLMWEKKCHGCGGLHDVVTRHPWTADAGKDTVWTWIEAVNDEGGTGYAGYTDWRLPTVKELQGIIDYERFNPAVPRAFHRAECGLGCEDQRAPACSCTAMSAYWSATPATGTREHAFVVGFHLGLIGDMRMHQHAAVRAVRAGRR
jgi:hypothetical protein